MVPNATALYVTYNTPALDLGWLPDDVPVVIVHNDSSLDPASVKRPGVDHLHSPANVGFGAGVNLGLPLVQTDRLVVANPDAFFGREHWEALVAAGEDEVVTVPLVEPEGRPTIVASRYPGPVSLVLMGWRVGRLVPRGSRRRRAVSPDPGPGSWPLASHWVSGAVLSVDVARFRAVGGFDADYFLYLEDVDLCGRLARCFPGMRARVADVHPAVHGVGGSVAGSRQVVERHRLDSTRRWAAGRAGPAWRVAGAALGLRAALDPSVR